ncbi:MAG: DUF4956 domain-containing protein [Oscillospiraceae bacterium]|nr:DUF4956 domain-containing protein [Oscillospiraceae bacterium]
MLNHPLSSVIQTELTISGVVLCTAVSLLLGLGVAAVSCCKNHCSKNFLVTLALLPAIVQIVIMMVNGNLGAGVATMGAFSLVRFRSIPGSAREIGSIFFAMAIGLATGMGYLGYAVIFFLLIAAAYLLLVVTPFGGGLDNDRMLKITIPEDLDYNGVFDDLLRQYTTSLQLTRVRTTNMGSLYELQYRVRLRNENLLKEFMDGLRCRNGNLNITCSRPAAGKDDQL